MPTSLTIKKVAAIALVLAIISVAMVSYYSGLFGHNSSSTTSNKETPHTIISEGTQYFVSDGAFRYIEFTISTFSTVSGSFNSTAGITIYIIPPSDNSSLSPHGVPLHYMYTTGHVEVGKIDTKLNSGSYDIMLANDNGLNAASVITFTSNLTSVS